MTRRDAPADIGLASTWLKVPKFERKKFESEVRVPFSPKMRQLIACYQPLYSLFLELEFDRAVVAFNLEPPKWPYEFEGKTRSLPIAGASIDGEQVVTLHINHVDIEKLSDPEIVTLIHSSRAWKYLAPRQKIWSDLDEVRRLDRVNKRAILSSLCPPNELSNPAIERDILRELSDVSRLCVLDVVRKLKHFDEQFVRTAISYLIVNRKIAVDMTRRYSMMSDLCLVKVDG